MEQPELHLIHSSAATWDGHISLDELRMMLSGQGPLSSAGLLRELHISGRQLVFSCQPHLTFLSVEVCLSYMFQRWLK